jgi:lipid-binding SYLF domain-containing protein
LNGATLRPDKESNTELYGSGVTNKQIVMGGKKRSPVAAAELTANLNKYSARKE